MFFIVLIIFYFSFFITVQRILSLANQNSVRDLSEPTAFRHLYRSWTRDISKISTTKNVWGNKNKMFICLIRDFFQFNFINK
jgi:hypothetical protein